jgi:hypothetical protein
LELVFEGSLGFDLGLGEGEGESLGFVVSSLRGKALKDGGLSTNRFVFLRGLITTCVIAEEKPSFNRLIVVMIFSVLSGLRAARKQLKIS